MMRVARQRRRLNGPGDQKGGCDKRREADVTGMAANKKASVSPIGLVGWVEKLVWGVSQIPEAAGAFGC